jgi:exopolysaccharide biosynthesis protein
MRFRDKRPKPLVITGLFNRSADPTYPTFKAQIVLIKNPKRVHVVVTKHIGKEGETVPQLTSDAHAILGINGGAFSDAGWRGNGGIPRGTTIVDGKFITYDPTKPVIGLTAYGQLVCGTYTKEQLKAMKVVEAVSFGPILVQNGRGVAPVDYSYQPRVAIGQRADGTIILIVTSGRFVLGANDLGATYVDIQNLMLKYGAVTAANLDGGSSATLVYKGKILNHPPDILGARMVATAIVVK